ncbi:Hypothetical protein GbCGDNIH9_8709 [Granulibacter bethesdensis]|uniref:Uncharacterized protein n=1 Tax=Granulibacter bethesdensis TaxID=364410 RepID=A0AAC9P829_9PROT|nr:Hypothetical protein GbCGDNIH9_8709 [Granulibacter bethesdensis]APH61329.1 Hypothetical protein GbCGDNIH8_8709 [Granulibacter bethesdensis]
MSLSRTAQAVLQHPICGNSACPASGEGEEKKRFPLLQNNRTRQGCSAELLN